MRKSVFIGAAMAAATVVPVYAADLGPVQSGQVMAVAPAAGYDWTGIYIGVHGGVNYLDPRVFIPAYPASFSDSSWSAAVGGRVGANYEFHNRIVVGVEAAASAIFNDHRSPTTFPGETWRVAGDWQADVVGRLGYAFDRFLPYVKGGVAFVNLDNLQYAGGGVPPVTTPLSRTYVGWTIGAGLDYALSQHWIVGIDYAYARFGGHTFVNGQIGPTRVTPATHMVLASLSYKFW